MKMSFGALKAMMAKGAKEPDGDEQKPAPGRKVKRGALKNWGQGYGKG